MLGFLIHRVGRVSGPLLQLVVRDVGSMLADERQNLMRYPLLECFRLRLGASEHGVVKPRLIDAHNICFVI